MPFPRLLLTPPVTKMYWLLRPLARASLEEEEVGEGISRSYGIQKGRPNLSELTTLDLPQFEELSTPRSHRITFFLLSRIHVVGKRLNPLEFVQELLGNNSKQRISGIAKTIPNDPAKLPAIETMTKISRG